MVALHKQVAVLLIAIQKESFFFGGGGGGGVDALETLIRTLAFKFGCLKAHAKPVYLHAFHCFKCVRRSDSLGQLSAACSALR